MVTLSVAARLASQWRRENTEGLKIQRKSLASFIKSHTGDDLMEIADFFYGPRVMGADRLMSVVSSHVGIFGEEWEGLLTGVMQGGAPLSELLASESAHHVPNGLHLTIPEATLLLYDLQKQATAGHVINTIFTRINRADARLLWERVLGDSHYMTKGRFIRVVSSLTDYDVAHLRDSTQFHGFGATMRGAIEGTLSRAREVAVNQPFMPATYRLWKEWTLPYERTAFDVVRGKRLFAHYGERETGDQRVYYYNRSGQRVTAPPVEFEHESAIAEIELRGGAYVVDVLHTDTEPQRWKKSYIERNPNAHLVQSPYHLRSLIKNLESGNTLRLIDADAPYFDAQCHGGYIAPRSLFEIPLLLTHLRVDDGLAVLRLAAMDGFDMEHVATVECEATVVRVPQLSGHLTSRWTEVDHLGVVVVCMCFGYEEGTVVSPVVLRVDGSLGVSDAIQKGDLLAITDGE